MYLDSFPKSNSCHSWFLFWAPGKNVTKAGPIIIFEKEVLTSFDSQLMAIPGPFILILISDVNSDYT